MDIEALDYALPDRLIAQHPADRRDDARLLVVDRASGSMTADTFRNVATYLDRGDCMVLNDTRVIRARLLGRKSTGGRVEIFLLRETGPGEWTALVRPSAKVREGTCVEVAEGIACEVLERLDEGARRVRFDDPDVLSILERAGHVPLPPYIHRDAPKTSDLRRYQTIYAERSGAVAAPTAGLHFTEDVFRALEEKGVQRTVLTLHVGYGTFKPIQTERVEDHVLDPERFDFPPATAQALNDVRAAGNRIVAVGTTSTRVLESCFQDGRFEPRAGATGHYIYPPYTFQAVDVLQTNFHLPRSSLLALVYAFGGSDLIREVYAYAIREEFRFYSYGDAMLII